MEIRNVISPFALSSVATLPLLLFLSAFVGVFVSLAFPETWPYAPLGCVGLLIGSSVWSVYILHGIPLETPRFIEIRDDAFLGYFAPPGSSRRGAIVVPFDSCRAFIGAGGRSSFPVRRYPRVIARGLHARLTNSRGRPSDEWKRWPADREIALGPGVLPKILEAWSAWSNGRQGRGEVPRLEIAEFRRASVNAIPVAATLQETTKRAVERGDGFPPAREPASSNK
jgi:hypothetical protein